MDTENLTQLKIYFSKLEDQSKKIIQKEKMLENNEKLRGMEDRLKWSSIHLMRDPGGGNRIKGRKYMNKSDSSFSTSDRRNATKYRKHNIH